MGWMKSFALIGSLTFSVMSIFEGKGHPPGVEPPTAYWLYHLSCRRQSLQRDIASATAVVSDTISKVSTKLDLSDTMLFQLFQKLKFKTQTDKLNNCNKNCQVDVSKKNLGKQMVCVTEPTGNAARNNLEKGRGDLTNYLSISVNQWLTLTKQINSREFLWSQLVNLTTRKKTENIFSIERSPQCRSLLFIWWNKLSSSVLTDALAASTLTSRWAAIVNFKVIFQCKLNPWSNAPWHRVRILESEYPFNQLLLVVTRRTGP